RRPAVLSDHALQEGGHRRFPRGDGSGDRTVARALLRALDLRLDPAPPQIQLRRSGRRRRAARRSARRRAFRPAPPGVGPVRGSEAGGGRGSRNRPQRREARGAGGHAARRRHQQGRGHTRGRGSVGRASSTWRTLRTPSYDRRVMETVTLTIDGRQVTVEKGKTVLQAAIESGISVPYYCYHPGIGIDGSCRVCIVKIEKMPKLQTSCSTMCTEGMVVQTRTPDVV